MMRLRRVSSSSIILQLEDGLRTSMRSAIVVQLIKYILYRRQQIPMTYDCLKNILREPSTPELPANKHRSPSSSLYDKVTGKKAWMALDNMDSVFDGIAEAFDKCRIIQQVLILIGGSIVSPKETFVIHLPPLNPETESKFSLESNLRKIFRQLFNNNFLNEAGDISATDTRIMFLAARDENMGSFHPKPTFKFNEKGRVYHVRIETCEPCGSQDLSYQDYDVNMSGVEPLSSSPLESANIFESLQFDSLISGVDVSNSMSTEFSSSISCDDSVSEKETLSTSGDMIWYQIPTVVKGYK